MKKQNLTIYGFLLLLFIILILAVLIEYRKNKFYRLLNNDKLLNNFKLEPELQENFAPDIPFSIDDVKIRDPNVDDEIKNNIGRKVLYVKGSGLNKIESVYFGNFNGSKIPSVSTDEELFILPPDFRKYNSDLFDMNNLEIKFLIKNTSVLTDPTYISDEETQIISNEKGKFILEFNDENTQVDDMDYITAELSFTVKSTLDEDVPIPNEIIIQDLFTNEKFKFGPLNFSKDKKQVTKLINVKQDGDKKIKLELSFKIVCPEGVDDPICKKDNINDNFNISNPKLSYKFDDINTMFPTGMFYKFNSLKEILENSEAWNIYLDSGTDRLRKFENTEVQTFYDKMKQIIDKNYKVEEKKVDPDIPTYDPRNLELKEDKNNSSLMILSWKKPTKSLNNDFTYVFNLIPVDEKENQFRIVNKKIPFEDEKYVFSNDLMVPTDKYKINLSVYNYPNKKILGEIEKEDYMYKPLDINKYHSHILDENGKFDTKITQSNPELVQTYFELTAFNKMKTQDNLMATKDHIEASSKCINNNLDLINKEHSKDKYDKNFEELLKKEQNEEATIFRVKQDEQAEDLARINNKIAKLEELQGKVSKNQDLKIKSVKSMNDGTNLSLINLENDNRLVKLNQGCLTKNNNDYNYIPCNAFNKEQHFNLNKVNNLDEYNNLLLMNNNAPLEESNNIEYPFYILQPKNSQKCVNVENKKLSIKPCTNDNTIRFTGNFINKNCSA